MSVEDSYRDMFREEKRKLKQLTPGQKVVYIWDYYKVQIMLILLILVIIGFLIFSYATGRKETVLYGVCINNSPNEAGRSMLTTGFMDYMEKDPKTHQMTYDFDLTLGSEFETGELDSNTIIKISAAVAAQDLDYIMSSEVVYRSYADAGMYYDLEELLPSDLWDQVKDSVVYYAPTMENANRHDEYATAINLTALTDIPETYEMEADPVYLGFICNTLHQDHCVAFLRYLLEQDNQ